MDYQIATIGDPIPGFPIPSFPPIDWIDPRLLPQPPQPTPNLPGPLGTWPPNLIPGVLPPVVIPPLKPDARMCPDGTVVAGGIPCPAAPASVEPSPSTTTILAVGLLAVGVAVGAYYLTRKGTRR